MEAVYPTLAGAHQVLGSLGARYHSQRPDGQLWWSSTSRTWWRLVKTAGNWYRVEQLGAPAPGCEVC